MLNLATATTTETVTYEVDRRYRLDICGSGRGQSAWLYDIGAGVKIEVGEDLCKDERFTESLLNEMADCVLDYERIITKIRC